jgi:ureidoacrylate peracid hydrolase
VFKIEATGSALLIIDMQNGFVEKNLTDLEVPMAREQIPAISKFINFIRKKNIPIIYSVFCVDKPPRIDFYQNIAIQRDIRASESNYHFRANTRDTEIVSELAPIDGEKIIEKSSYDCFIGTDLDHHLNTLGISSIIIAGTVLNWCVDSTVRSAYHRNYNVTVLADAVSSYDHAGAKAKDWCRMELDLFAEAFGRVVTSDDAIDEMENADR